MRSQLDCPTEESEQLKSSDEITWLIYEREPIGPRIQESEQGLERYLSRWLTMYTAVQKRSHSDGPGL
jgi:hypothetical protein